MAKRGPRQPVGLSWIVTWPLLVVFAAMVFLCADELGRPTGEAATFIGADEWEARLPARIDAVTAALESSSLRLTAPIEKSAGSESVRYTHRLYQAPLHSSGEVEVEVALETLRALDSGLTVQTENRPNGLDVNIGLDGLLTHTLEFRSDQVKPLPARLALVVRGLGDDLLTAREVTTLDAPVAMAVRPFRTFSAQVAELGRLFDRPVLLQVSLRVGEAVPPGDAAALNVSHDLPAQLDGALASVPQAVGVLADLDADLRSTPSLLEPFLLELNQRQLGFVTEGLVPDALKDAVAATGTVAELHTVVVEIGADLAESPSEQLDKLAERAIRGDAVVAVFNAESVGSSRVDLQACKLEYSIVSPK